MHLLELAIQNVRGFSPAGRHPLKLGYVVLRGPEEAPPLGALALALLYPDGRGGDAELAAPGQRGGKAALSLQGNDGVTYRLLRELGGAGGLHRLNPETRQPELVTQDAAEMVQVLRAQAGLPTRATFEQLYCLRTEQLPSRKPRRSAPVAGAARASQTGLAAGRESSVGAGLGAPVTAAVNVSAAQDRVRVLETELALCREVEALQFEADGVSSQIFETEAPLQGLEALREHLAAAQAEAKAQPDLRALGLPDDILARVERYPGAVSRRDEALARLRSEQEELEAQVPAAVAPLWRERAFWGWVGSGVLALILGLVLDSPGQYVALLDVPLFGMAALMALRYVDELQHASRQVGRGGRGAARERKILEEFEAETLAVHQAVRALDVDGPAEVAAVLARRKALADRVEQLDAERVLQEQDPAVASVPALLEGLRAQLATLNARIEAKGAYTRDAREVERELARTRESIELALQLAQAPAAASGAGAPVAALEDPTPALLALAAELLGADLPTVMGLLHARCLQYFTALTDRRYPVVEWDKEGRAQVVLAGRKLPVGELPGKDVDLYAIALRMTVVERASSRLKMPFLVEDVFAGLDEVKLPLVARMLKHLGTLTQVVHATAHPGFAQMADASASV